MNRISGLPLLIVGALLILAPIVRQAIASERDKERIAELLSANPSMTVPSELRSSSIGGYDWACFGIGVGIAFSGVGQLKRPDRVKPQPQKWETPEL